MSIVVPSAKEAPSLGELIEIVGVEFPDSETIICTSSVEVYVPSETVSKHLYTPIARFDTCGELLALLAKFNWVGPYTCDQA